MGLSSNTILHTTDKEGLFGILKELSFKIFYCNENVVSENRKNTINAAFPMVSFSDFPVSELKYRQTYGHYGIGMTKIWANKNKLNPVIYMAKQSQLTSDYFNQFVEIHNDMKLGKPNKKWFDSIIYMLSFMKNYQGHLVIKKLGIDNKNYRFSDEREWRYVPTKNDLKAINAPLFLNGPNYSANKDKWNHILNPIRLKFQIKDINYIIIEKDSEINEFIKYIKQCHSGLTEVQSHALCSKMISLVRIQNDF